MMNWRFAVTTIDQIGARILKRISGFPSIIDGFLVDHIYDSNHYRIFVDENEAGYFSIHDKSHLTQFYLGSEYSGISQQIYFNVRKMENVRFAFVPTCDEYFLSHALDDCRQVEKQAYFFNHDSNKGRIKIDPRFLCRVAETTEIDFIKNESGHFFAENELPERLNKGEIWISYYDNVGVGFGLIIRSKLFPDVADLGMYTIEKHRRHGYGRLTVQSLINKCLNRELRIAAGCWYYNHNSKKTLESAGMHSNTRLLKIRH